MGKAGCRLNGKNGKGVFIGVWEVSTSDWKQEEKITLKIFGKDIKKPINFFSSKETSHSMYVYAYTYIL